MYYSAYPGALSCNYCQAGTFNNVTASSKCDRCREPSACYCSRR
jgi:hypothetical protein